MERTSLRSNEYGFYFTGKDWRAIAYIFTGVLFFGGLGTIYANLVTPKSGEPQSLPHTPKYVTGDCFAQDGIRETWEGTTDGIIVTVGQAKYLWEPWSVVEKNYGKKPWRKYEYAIPSDMTDLDNRTHKVECPIKGVH